jgi:hypothetical protein
LQSYYDVNIDELYEMRIKSYVTACCRIVFSLGAMFFFIEHVYINIFIDIVVPIDVCYNASSKNSGFGVHAFAELIVLFLNIVLEAMSQ